MNDAPVIFQGTFDPFTMGHLAMVKQMRELFGPVRILLLINPDKTPLFSVEERKQIILQAIAGLSGVSVDSYDGWLVDYMRARNLTVNVRGVRNGADATYELANHHISQKLYPALRTFLLPCPSCLRKISSSAVKQACASGQLPQGWVPAAAEQKLSEKYIFTKVS